MRLLYEPMTAWSDHFAASIPYRARIHAVLPSYLSGPIDPCASAEGIIRGRIDVWRRSLLAVLLSISEYMSTTLHVAAMTMQPEYEYMKRLVSNKESDE